MAIPNGRPGRLQHTDGVLVKGYPGFHIIHRDNNQDEVEAHLGRKMNLLLWHQDVSYERRPQDTSRRAQMLAEIRCLQRPPTRIGKYFHILPFLDCSHSIFEA